jgi:hypothetical protein
VARRHCWPFIVRRNVLNQLLLPETVPSIPSRRTPQNAVASRALETSRLVNGFYI